MEITQSNTEKNGHFKAVEDGKQAGLMTYTWAGPEKLIIDHTEVNPDFRGRDVGKKMVHAAVDYARKNNLKIMPLCPFAAAVFRKDETLSDVRF
jgi:predicted GNAT family acetyltransferase